MKETKEKEFDKAIIEIATEKAKEHIGQDGREFTEIFGLPVFLYLARKNPETKKVEIKPIKKSYVLEHYPSMNAFIDKASLDMEELFKHSFFEIYDSSFRDDCIILSNNTAALSPSILLYKKSWNEVLDFLKTDEVYIMPTMIDGILVVNLEISEENTEELRKEIESIRESEQITLDSLITDKLFYFKRGMKRPRPIED